MPCSPSAAPAADVGWVATAALVAVLLFALAVPLAVPLIVAASVLVGLSSEVFMVNWVTTMQHEIPPDLMSRLSSFDAFGRFALAPSASRSPARWPPPSAPHPCWSLAAS